MNTQQTPPPRWLRALATWLVIAPLVTLGQWVMNGFPPLLPLAGRVLILTAIVVPVAVYVGVPLVLYGLGRLRARSSKGQTR